MKQAIFFCLALALFLSTIDFAGTPNSHKKRCVAPAVAQDFLDAHMERQSRMGVAIQAASQEAGDILVLEADPELLILSNAFDLKSQTIHFQPALRGRYTYSLAPDVFDSQASEAVPLKDDDSFELVFRNFLFPFGNQSYDRCFINSNGNITFGKPDPDPPGADSALRGTPRIAAFFADLDPESSGTIFVNQSTDKVTISWLKVPEFFNQDQFDFGQNTFQIVLSQDGRIDLVYSDEISATQAFVGITSGSGNAPLKMVDFTRGISRGRPSFSLLEDFHDYESIDIPRFMHSLYTIVSDRFDFVTLLSNFDLTPVPGAQAFAINVRNGTRGIGDPSEKGTPVFSNNAKYGSSQRLQNITFLGNIHQYPSNPLTPMPDLQVSLLQVLAHEVGHRWLSYVKLSKPGISSDVLLGRDQSHWSFFFDTNGSLLEGNQISQKRLDSFVTQAPFQGYSRLDLYLMGFLPAQEVRDSFVVQGASHFSPDFPFSAESEPEPNVSFRGAALPVRIADILAANGARRPSDAASQKQFRHLFVLIARSQTPATPEEISSVDALRTSWESFFLEATGGKGTVDTRIH